MNLRIAVPLALAASVAAALALGAFGPDLGAALELGLSGVHPGDGSPPALEVRQPADGAGVTGLVRIMGEARANGTGITDVHVRVDGGPWQSVTTVPRGAAVAAWVHELDAGALAPGPHLLEFRADNGDQTSLPHALRIATHPTRAPPTLELATPRPGDGVRTDQNLTLRGTLAGVEGGPRVEVRIEGLEPQTADVQREGQVAHWATTFSAGSTPEGPFTVEVVAWDADGVAAHPLRFQLAGAERRAPPRADLLSPLPAEGYGRDGDPTCVAAPPCVSVRGTLTGVADQVFVSVDGGTPEPVENFTAGRFAEAPLGGTFEFALPLSSMYGGPHEVQVWGAREGVSGAATARTFLLNTEGELRITPNVTAAPTFTPLRFSLDGGWGGPWNVTWRIDDIPAEAGPVLDATFERPGIHEVSARAVDPEGRVAFAEATVAALNRPPIAEFRAEGELRAGEPVRLNASGSHDPDGFVTAYRAWHAGTVLGPWQRSPHFTTTFETVGNVTVTMETRDDLGAVNLSTQSFTVLNTPPRLQVFSPVPHDPSVRHNVTFRAHADDVEGAPALTWDLGDGTRAEGPVVVHRYAEWGTYTIRVTARDAFGERATARLTLEVRNTPPLPAFETDPPAPTTAAAVRFLDRSVDLDGNLTTWRWDFGDNTTAHCTPSGCRYEDDAGHTWNTTNPTPTHTYTRHGLYTVRLNVTDDAGAHAETRRLVPALNRPPDANFTWSPLVPVAHHDLVQFHARVRDLDGPVANWTWDFGDGTRYACDSTGCRNRDGRPVLTSVASADRATHRFLTRGLHTVHLNVTDDAGGHARHAATFFVMNAPPVVDLQLPDAAYAAHPFTLRVDAKDLDGRITRVRWDLNGDGVWDRRHEGSAQVAMNLTEPGTYPIRVEVADDAHTTAQDRATLVVYPPPRGALTPGVLVYTPATAETLQGRVTFTGRVDAITDVARVEYQIRRDGWALDLGDGLWVKADGGTEWVASFESTRLDDGDYELVVRAEDARGDWGETRVPFTVDNAHGAGHDITLDVLTPQRGARVGGLLTVEGAAYHPAGLDQVRVRIADGPWKIATLQAATWFVEVDTRSHDGPANLTVEAYRGGVVHRTVHVPLHLENRAPQVAWVTELPDPTVGRVTLRVGLAPDTPVHHVEWRVDEHPWREATQGADGWAFQLDARDYANGTHRLSVRAKSPTGIPSTVYSMDFRSLHAPAPDPGTATGEPLREAPNLPWVAALALGAAAASRRRFGDHPPKA